MRWNRLFGWRIQFRDDGAERPLDPGAARELPEWIGHHRVLGHLGEGAMGVVYKATAPDGRVVAVKVVQPKLAGDQHFKMRFWHEVDAARQVPPTCTAEVLGAHLDGDLLYLVTGFIDGQPLQKALRPDQPLKAAELEQFATRLAEALVAIHDAGVVHRDLKPQNVLMPQDGPRVIDFGIARALDAATGLTRDGQVAGTPAFMAPEQFQGLEATPAVDVFAWGGVVLYAATRMYPFGGGTLEEISRRVQRDEPDLTALNGTLRDTVAYAMLKDPADRPDAKRLVQCLKGEVQPPKPQTTGVRQYKPQDPGGKGGGPARSRWKLAGALALGLIIGAVGALSVRGAVANDPKTRPLAELFDLSGVSVTVGSKQFVEQRILGQLAFQVLDAAGADVTDRTGLVGTQRVREALLSGGIHLYFEYTGTGWIDALGNVTWSREPATQFDQVRAADAANGITWTAMAGANNSYVLVANQDGAARHGVTDVSAYAELAKNDPADAALCITTEFERRPDGLEGLEQHYEFDLPAQSVIPKEPDQLYDAVAAGQQCDFAVAFNTSPLTRPRNLQRLPDDRQFFPAYNIAMTMRTEVYEANAGAYEALFTAISGKLDNDRMRELNDQVENGQPPSDVARAFLEGEGII